MITGYYYSDTVVRGRMAAQIKKLLILVIEANLLYLVWKCFYAVVTSNGMLEYLKDNFTLKNAVKFFVLNESPFNGHLWYLGAILYVLIIMELARRLHLERVVYYAVLFLLLGDLALGKYSILLWGREFPYILVRNWLFVGIPYFMLGVILREKVGAKRLSLQKLTAFTVLFSLTTLAERFFLVGLDANATRDHYISTTFLAITVFMLFLQLYRERQPGKIEGLMATVGRKHSTWIYIIHPIFISVLAVMMRKAGVYGAYRYAAPIVVYLASILFVAAVCRVTERVRLLQRQK